MAETNKDKNIIIIKRINSATEQGKSGEIFSKSSKNFLQKIKAESRIERIESIFRYFNKEYQFLSLKKRNTLSILSFASFSFSFIPFDYGDY